MKGRQLRSSTKVIILLMSLSLLGACAPSGGDTVVRDEIWNDEVPSSAVELAKQSVAIVVGTPMRAIPRSEVQLPKEATLVATQRLYEVRVDRAHVPSGRSLPGMLKVWWDPTVAASDESNHATEDDLRDAALLQIGEQYVMFLDPFQWTGEWTGEYYVAGRQVGLFGPFDEAVGSYPHVGAAPVNFPAQMRASQLDGLSDDLVSGAFVGVQGWPPKDSISETTVAAG